MSGPKLMHITNDPKVIERINNRLNTIGKQNYFSIQIQSINVSGRHAVIEVTNKEVSIIDNNSKNFTYINGNRIFPNNKNILIDGDVLTLADQKFEVSICR